MSASPSIVGHWVAVSEAMPDDEITVLVWDSMHADGTLAYHDTELLEEKGDSGWVQVGTNRRMLGVSHWCADILPPSDH